MRSIQVINVRWFNATAWYGLYLSRLLREAGHETLVIGMQGTSSFKLAKNWGLDPVAMPMNTNNPIMLAHLYGDLSRLIEKFKPDLVNCHRGEAFALWALLKNRYDFALVRTRGDQRLPKNNLINRWLHNKAADAVISTNSILANYFTGEMGLKANKVFTILGGVDTTRFYPDKNAGLALRASLDIADDEFVIGILGRFDPVKGHEVLIKALGEVKKLHPERKLRLICIGSESNLKNVDIMSMAGHAGIGKELKITGIIDDVPAYINMLDLGVLASVGSEAIARAALEIIACEVPLISTKVGVMPDIFPSEILLEPGDQETLAAKTSACLEQPDNLEILREYGRKAMQSLRPENFLEKSLTAYSYAIQAKDSNLCPE